MIIRTEGENAEYDQVQIPGGQRCEYRGVSMPAESVALLFFVHLFRQLNHTYRLDKERQGKGNRELVDFCFSRDEKRNIILYSRNCLVPALEVLSGWIDDGMKFSMCLTGTTVDLLEKHSQDAYDLLAGVAGHKNTELIGKTYYNSIAALFDSPDEYGRQLKLHREMVEAHFKARPTCLSVDWNLFRPHIVPAILSEGYESFFITGIEKAPGEGQPAGVYSYNGIPSLVSHCMLADDVAARFSDASWDQYPLTAAIYADWIRGTGVENVPIQFGIESFGCYHRKKTGIFEFLSALPGELSQRGIEPLTASEAISFRGSSAFPALPDPPSATGVHLGQGLMMNMDQYTAFSAIRNARRITGDTPLLRHLEAVDHLQAMAMKSGWCGRPPRSRSQHEAHDAFSLFMHIISDLETRASTLVRSRKAARVLRSLPPDKAFHFSYPHRHAGFSAHSLAEFLEMISFAPDEVIAFHLERGDFARWIEEVLEDTILAREVQQCQDRNGLENSVRVRFEYLEKRLK